MHTPPWLQRFLASVLSSVVGHPVGGALAEPRRLVFRLIACLCLSSSLLCRFVPLHGMLIARVLVTPTRIVCLPPEVELSNRVVRHFRYALCPQPAELWLMLIQDDQLVRLCHQVFAQIVLLRCAAE